MEVGEARTAQLPDEGAVDSDVVDRRRQRPGIQEGCVVGVDYGDGDVERFLFANRENATGEGGKIGDLDVYSPESPIGQAIAGHRAGDEIVFSPRSTRITIVSITPYAA